MLLLARSGNNRGASKGVWEGDERRQEDIPAITQGNMRNERCRDLYAEDFAGREVLLVETLVQPELMDGGRMRGVGCDVGLPAIMGKGCTILKDRSVL